MKKKYFRMSLILFVTVTAIYIPAQAQNYPTPIQIRDIDQFLDECPTNDPIYPFIREDFGIRRNGELVGNINCSEPVSQMPISEYTDELILVQGLRVIYNMDRGRNGPIPWTSETIYDWMKSKIRGINISDTAGSSYCCVWVSDGWYIVVKSQDDSNRELDRQWNYLRGNIGLYVHEVRHIDGFGHVSCCGISGGCDQTYDENNLAPYGTQWWLNWAWLTGYINLGLSCLPPGRTQWFAGWHLSSCNYTFQNRFCDNLPPELSMPENPGGPCPSACIGDFEPDGDVDGQDLEAYIADQSGISLNDLAINFGRFDCF